MFNPMMYLQMLGGGQNQQRGGGFFSNPMVQAMGLGFGGDVLQGVSDLVGGETEEEKRRKKMYQMGLAELGSNRDVINPMGVATKSWAATLPMINKRAKEVGARMNLDSGQAEGAMIEGTYPTFMNILAEADIKNQLAKAERRGNMFSTMMGRY